MFIFYVLIYILYLKKCLSLPYNYEEEIKHICTIICNKYNNETYIECLDSCL